MKYEGYMVGPALRKLRTDRGLSILQASNWIVEYTSHVPSNTTGAYYYDAREALGTALTNYINGGDLASELQTAEDTVNFAMGF